jgi:MFS family permease
MGRSFQDFIHGGDTNVSSSPPRLLKLRSSKRFILATVCIAVFTDLFLYGIVVPVIPFAISSRAGVPKSDVQYWVSVLLAVYGVAILVASPISGWYADRLNSRRLPLLIGLVALAGATAMLCLARNVGLLVAGRVLQGLSAAIVWVVGQALLADTVGEKDIGQVMGYVTISLSLAVLLAPLLGGVVYSQAGYYPVFYMAFALIFLDIFLRLALIEKKIAIQWIEEEPNQESTTAPQKAGVAGPSNNKETVSEPIESEKVVATSPGNDSGPPISQRSKYPPILTLLASRRLLAALWGCMMNGSIMTAFDSVIPLFVQRVFGWDSMGAGLVFLSFIIPSFAAPLVGTVCDRYGPRWLIVVGFLLAAPLFVLLRFVTEDTLNHKVLLCALLALTGVTLTLVGPPLMAEITYVVEAKEKKNPGIFGNSGAYAQAYGLFVLAWAAGSLCGPLWAGLLQDSAGWSTMTWTFGLFSAFGALPALIWTGGLITIWNAKGGDERPIESNPKAEDQV